VALGGQSETVELWNTTTKERTIFEENPKPVSSLAFSPDSKTLAVGCYKQVKLWDTTTSPEVRQVRPPFKGHTENVIMVKFFPDCKTLATASKEEAKVWELTPGKEPANFKGGSSGNWVLFPNGKTLAKCGAFVDGKVLYLWDVAAPANREEIHPGGFGGLYNTFTAVCSADSRRLAVGSNESVLVYDAATWAKLPGHTLHTDLVHSVDLSPDGNTLASGDFKGEVILWNIDKEKEIDTLKRLKGRVRVRFSPCGKILATGGDKDTIVNMWNATTGKWMGELPGHTGGVAADFQFSSDGQTLAVMGPDQVKLWNVASFTLAVK
jgi:WD40 repeat protein